MSEQPGDELGEFACTCCCNRTIMWTVYNEAYMHCTGCGCNRERVDLRLKIRVYAVGQMNVKAMEKLLELANLLGVDDSSVLVTEGVLQHYVDIPAEGISTRLEIARIAPPAKRSPR